MKSCFFEHKRNETNSTRCVGLVIETRPDNISAEEVNRIRKLGCTKTQIGFQSLNDKVLELNHRGHDVDATIRAVDLLRWSGFKIHAHWMANLYGSDVAGDVGDYKKMFDSSEFRPDELKVYPCSLIETAELMDYYNQGLWRPYTYNELYEVLSEVIKNTPEYCRLTRIIRDIPGTDIVTGNKITNFRQIIEDDLKKQSIVSSDIRAREIKNQKVTREELTLKKLVYNSSVGVEVFLQFVTKENKIVGFLRLSLPGQILKDGQDMKNTDDVSLVIRSEEGLESGNFTHPFTIELNNSSMIREIHVYGAAANIGEKSEEKAQHLGLGKELISEAKTISESLGYTKMSVISAVGTREYYRKRGFKDGELYQYLEL